MSWLVGLGVGGDFIVRQLTSMIFESRYASNLVNVRFAAKPLPNERLVVFIPGGPGISGKYMDDYAHAVGLKLGTNVAVLDLPNHDGSRVAGKTENFRYSQVRQLLAATIKELVGNGQGGEVTLVGHSLGALIAMDLALQPGVRLSKLLLSSVPTTFDNSPSFVDGMKKAGVAEQSSWASEAEFSAWWQKLIPLYFKRPPTDSEFAALNSKTFWIGNEHYSDDLPAFDVLAGKLRSSAGIPIFYLEGECDQLLPLANYKKVQTELPNARTASIGGVGHFPMFEALETTVHETVKFLS